METISLVDIRESSQIKVETCKSCIEDLKGTLSKEQYKNLKKRFILLQKGIYSSKRL